MQQSVHLIPVHIHDMGMHHIIPYTDNVLQQCEAFFCENIKTARRFVKFVNKNFEIDSKQWFTIDKHDIEGTTVQFIEALKNYTNIGIMSEAGCPAVADPGSTLVTIAHTYKAKVLPLTGPSSIMLSLMASGFNGQRFLFEGYLPIQPAERQQKLQQLELFSKKENCTIIFIEAPYRNVALYEAIIKSCNSDTSLCIASNITGPEEYIKTLKIANWKTIEPPIQFIQKINTIFLLYAG